MESEAIAVGDERCCGHGVHDIEETLPNGHGYEWGKRTRGLMVVIMLLFCVLRSWIMEMYKKDPSD